jgi:hypothetical protein
MGWQGITRNRGAGELIDLNIARGILGNISRSRVYQLKDEGALGPVYKIGSLVRVTRNGVVDFLSRCRES